jgi:hypothetical protein
MHYVQPASSPIRPSRLTDRGMPVRRRLPPRDECATPRFDPAAQRREAQHQQERNRRTQQQRLADVALLRPGVVDNRQWNRQVRQTVQSLPVRPRGNDGTAHTESDSQAARAPDLAHATRARCTAHRPAKTARQPQSKAPVNRQYSQRWFPQPQRHGQLHTPGDSAPIAGHRQCVADRTDRHRRCATLQPAATAHQDYLASKGEPQKRQSASSFTTQVCFLHRAETFTSVIIPQQDAYKSDVENYRTACTRCAGVSARMGALIAVLRYVDPCPGLPCCAGRPCRAACRPKFISVIAWGALFPGVFNLVQQVQLL